MSAPVDMIEVTRGARVYIAARFSRRPECNQLGHLLKAKGCTITSRWIKPDADHVLPTGLSRQAEDSERQRFALEDVEDVRAADWTISLMEEPRSNTRGGRHIEFGMAAALGHRLTIIGPRETVFHHLPNVEHFATIDEFVASLPDRIVARTDSLTSLQSRVEELEAFFAAMCRLSVTEYFSGRLESFSDRETALDDDEVFADAWHLAAKMIEGHFAEEDAVLAVGSVSE